MKKRRTIERCVRLGVAIACVSAATVLRAGDRAEVSVAGSERADTASFRDIYPDTWVATDAVGRTMPTEEEVGLPKNDQRRVVGIFYITWHTQGLHNLKSPYTADVTKILEQDRVSMRIIRSGRKAPITGASPRWAIFSVRTSG